MRRWRAGLIVVLVALATGSGSGQEPKAARGGRYALLVGVRQYRPNTLRNLEFTEADVTRLAEVLEASGYRRRDITILTQTLGATDAGLLPTGENIRSQLGIPAWPLSKFTPGLKLGPLNEDDSLLVAFAGHGVQFKAAGDSFFCPMDANLTDESTLIGMSDVSKALDGCKAGFKLLLVDACRDNPQIQAGRNGNRPVVDLKSLSKPFQKPKPGGTMAMFSCSPGQVAYEDDAKEVKHGIFFHHVIRALNGDPGWDDRLADLDGDGKVDTNELAKYAEKNVAAHAAERYRSEQIVEVANRTRGSVAIVDRRGDIQTLTNSIGMKLNLIPAGAFDMGTPDSEAKEEKPLHRVRITRPFYLGTYEVTQAEYRAVMGTNPSWFSVGGGGEDTVAGMDTSRFPVETVSWLDAVMFCNMLSEREGLRPCYGAGGEVIAGGTGYRLPTEAEWEYACRARTMTAFAFGDRLSYTKANFYGNSTYGNPSYNGSANVPYLGRTAPEGSYPPNAFGLINMHGNILEWCSDWYDDKYYAKSPVDDPSGPSHGSNRAIRGGSWGSAAEFCRAAHRYGSTPTRGGTDLGVRLARVRAGG